MSIEENKKLVRRFYEELWNKGNYDIAYDLVADNYVRHDLRPGNPPGGPAGQARVAQDFRAAFPDLEFHLDLLIAEADMVAARWTMRGTNTGPWGNVAPTGRKAEFSGVNLFRITDGKIAEIWNHRDDLGLREQMNAPIYAGSNQ